MALRPSSRAFFHHFSKSFFGGLFPIPWMPRMILGTTEPFCKVAETESFSRAGEAIYLPQPTVSGHIAALEQMVGLKLFDRLGRRVALTNGGRIFYRYAKEILRLRDEALT